MWLHPLGAAIKDIRINDPTAAIPNSAKPPSGTTMDQMLQYVNDPGGYPGAQGNLGDLIF